MYFNHQKIFFLQNLINAGNNVIRTNDICMFGATKKIYGQIHENNSVTRFQLLEQTADAGTAKYPKPNFFSLNVVDSASFHC